MASELQGTFVNYYEILGVAEDAPTATIEAALQTYRTSQEMRLNNQLSMTASRSAINEIIPAIERILLNDAARAHYNQQMADIRRKQNAHYEPEDYEGLDDPLRIPFLFNPFDDFDTEMPGYTLRSIANKLDEEWASARKWITDTEDETHGFVSYLTFVANRKQLAERIEHIIESVSPENEERMDVNEGIERCIDILDPRVERPVAGVHNLTFDGRTLDAGSFITDLPAQSELILGNDGVRGCVFGVIESQTNWLTFGNGQSSVRFALMPAGTKAEIGPSEVKIPLHFAVGNLARNADYGARVLIHMENQVNPIEQLIQVQIHMLPLPPRVVLMPDATQEAPIWMGITRRGVATHAIITPRNFGDEALVPLIARISTKDGAASVRPYEFHSSEPITLTIETSNRPHGEKYAVAFDIEYVTSQAQGPTTVYAQGEILPTSWQSMTRTRGIGERMGVGCLGGIGGLTVLSFSGAELATRSGFTAVLFLALPILFILVMRVMASTVIVHMRNAGNTAMSLGNVSQWVLWGIPLGVGLVLSLLCTFVFGTTTSLVIGAFAGFIVGGVIGFLAGKPNTGVANAAPTGNGTFFTK